MSPKEKATVEKLEAEIAQLEKLHLEFVGQKVESVETGIDILAQVIRVPSKGGRGGTVFGYELSSGTWKKPSELQGEKVIGRTGRIEEDIGTAKFFPTPESQLDPIMVQAEANIMKANAKLFSSGKPSTTWDVKEAGDNVMGMGRSPEEFGSVVKEQGTQFQEYGHMYLFEEKVGRFWAKPQARMLAIKYDAGARGEEAKMLVRGLTAEQYDEFMQRGIWQGLPIDVKATEKALAGRGKDAPFEMWFKGETLDESMRELFIGARQTTIGWLSRGKAGGKGDLQKVEDAYLTAQAADPENPFAVMSARGLDIDEELLFKSLGAGDNKGIIGFETMIDEKMLLLRQRINVSNAGSSRDDMLKELGELQEQKMIIYDEFYRADWMMKALEGTDLLKGYMAGGSYSEEMITQAIMKKAVVGGSQAKRFQSEWAVKEFQGGNSGVMHRLDYTPAQLKYMKEKIVPSYWKEYVPFMKETTYNAPVMDAGGKLKYGVQRDFGLQDIVGVGLKYYAPQDAARVVNKGTMPEVVKMAEFHGDLLGAARSYIKAWETYKGQTFWKPARFDKATGRVIGGGERIQRKAYEEDFQFSTRAIVEKPYKPTKQQVIDDIDRDLNPNFDTTKPVSSTNQKYGDGALKGKKYDDLTSQQRESVDEVYESFMRGTKLDQELKAAKKDKFSGYKVIDEKGKTVKDPEKQEWNKNWMYQWRRSGISKETYGFPKPPVTRMLLTQGQRDLYGRWTTRLNMMGGRTQSINVVKNDLDDLLRQEVPALQQDVQRALELVDTKKIASEMATQQSRGMKSFLEDLSLDANELGVIINYGGRFTMKAEDKATYALARSKVLTANKQIKEHNISQREVDDEIGKIEGEAMEFYDTVQYVPRDKFGAVKLGNDNLPLIRTIQVKPKQYKGHYEPDKDFSGRQGYDNVKAIDRETGQPIFNVTTTRKGTGEFEGSIAANDYREIFTEVTTDNPVWRKYQAVIGRKQMAEIKLRDILDEKRSAESNKAKAEMDIDFLRSQRKGKYDPSFLVQEKLDVQGKYKSLQEITDEKFKYGVLRNKDGETGYHNYYDLDVASAKKVRNVYVKQHAEVDAEYGRLIIRQQDDLSFLLGKAGKRSFKTPTGASTFEAIRAMDDIPIMKGTDPFGYLPKVYRDIMGGRIVKGGAPLSEAEVAKMTGGLSKDGFFDVVTKMFPEPRDKQAFATYMLREMYYSRSQLQRTQKLMSIEEATIATIQGRLKKIDAEQYDNVSPSSDWFSWRARLEGDLEYHMKRLGGDTTQLESHSSLKSQLDFWQNQFDETKGQVTKMQGWAPEGTSAEVKTTQAAVQAKKELGWAEQSYSSKQKALTDALELKKELENEIAIFAEKNTVKIDPSSEGFIGVDAEKRATELFSGLGDTTFIGQYLKQSQKTMTQDWGKTMEWFTGKAARLPSAGSGRIYKVNVFDIGTGGVPAYGNLTKPLKGGLIARLYEHVFRTPLQEPIGIGKTTVRGTKIKERVWDEETGEFHIIDVPHEKIGGTSKYAISRDTIPFRMGDAELEFAGQVLVRTHVKEDFLRRLWQDINKGMTKAERKKILDERLKAKEDNEEIGFNVVTAGQKNVMWHHVKEAEKDLAAVFGVKKVSLRPYADKIVDSLRADKKLTRSWMEGDFDRYTATIGGERGFSIREKIGMTIAKRQEVQALVHYSTRARQMLEIQRQKMLNAEEQLVYGGKQGGSFRNFVDLYSQSLKVNEKEIALKKANSELVRAEDIIGKYKSTDTVEQSMPKFDSKGQKVYTRKPMTNQQIAMKEFVVKDDYGRGLEFWGDVGGTQSKLLDMSGNPFKIGTTVKKGEAYLEVMMTKKVGGRPKMEEATEMQSVNRDILETDLKTGKVVGWEGMSDEMKLSLRKAFERKRELENDIRTRGVDLKKTKEEHKEREQFVMDQMMLHSTQLDDFLIKFFKSSDSAGGLRKKFLERLTQKAIGRKEHSKVWDDLELAAKELPSGDELAEQRMIAIIQKSKLREKLTGKSEGEYQKAKITALQRKYIEQEMRQYGYSDPNLNWYYTNLRYPATAPPWTRSEWYDKELLPAAHGEEQSTKTGDLPASEPEPEGGSGMVVPDPQDSFTEISNIDSAVDINIIAQNISDITGQFQSPNLVSGVRSALYTPQRMGQSGRIDLDSILREGVKQQHRQDSVQIPSLHPVTQETFEVFPRPFTRFPPAAFLPIFPFFPDYRRRPKRSRMVKRPKRKIWWDVPEQPLGEPWAATEYRVFGTAGQAGEPAYVQKKEDKKKLDGTPFGIPIDQDVNFWTQHNQDRGGFTMRRQVAKDSQGRTVKDKKGKTVRYKPQKAPWKRQRGWTMPDSE